MKTDAPKSSAALSRFALAVVVSLLVEWSSFGSLLLVSPEIQRGVLIGLTAGLITSEWGAALIGTVGVLAGVAVRAGRRILSVLRSLRERFRFSPLPQ